MASQVFTHIFLLLLLVHSSILVSSNKILSNIKFLKPLSVVQKGNNVKALKKYLIYLGYYNHNCSSNNQTNENNNIFDNNLKLALKKYQKFYKLNITGVLDPNTIAKMHSPRCGMPDFYNCRNARFLKVSRYMLMPGLPKWHKTKLTYAFKTNTKRGAILPLERALREWASVSHFKFLRVRNLSVHANIRFSFVRGYHGDDLPFGGPDNEGGLAHSFAPPDGGVHFDAAQNWSSKGHKTGFDIRTIGLHELGHVLGLDHTDVEEAVMFPTISPGEIKHLHQDDIKGIKALYNLK